jgi:predicted ester cyclase
MEATLLRDKARRWLYGIFEADNFDILEEMAADDWRFQLGQNEPIRANEFPKMVAAYRAAFDLVNNTYEEQVVEGEVVVTRGTSHMKHVGPFGDIPATGKTVHVPWVIFTRFEGDRVVEDWELWDEMSLMRQLGAIPEAAQ